MKRPFLVGLVAIAALFGGSIAILLVVTGPGPTPTSTAGLEATADALAPQAVPVESDPAAGRGSAGGPYRARRASATRAAPGPAADRVTRKAIKKALGAGRLQSPLARCVEQSGGFGQVSSGERVPRARPASLFLEIEIGAGQLRIAGVQVQDFGGASEASVSCAREVLVGRVVPVPKRRRPRPEHVWMTFSLNPRSYSVASSR